MIWLVTRKANRGPVVGALGHRQIVGNGPGGINLRRGQKSRVVRYAWANHPVCNLTSL